MTAGINASVLSDDDLRRELAHLKAKTDDIGSGGTAHQQANHRSRTAELEAEFLRRNPAATPDPVHDDKSAHSDDVSPAGPDDGPVDDQPQTAAGGEQTAKQPADAPTDDPDRPSNPA